MMTRLGTTDGAPGGSVTSLTFLKDESTVVGDTFSPFNKREISAPTRLFSDGTSDPSFSSFPFDFRRAECAGVDSLGFQPQVRILR